MQLPSVFQCSQLCFCFQYHPFWRGVTILYSNCPTCFQSLEYKTSNYKHDFQEYCNSERLQKTYNFVMSQFKPQGWFFLKLKGKNVYFSGDKLGHWIFLPLRANNFCQIWKWKCLDYNDDTHMIAFEPTSGLNDYVKNSWDNCLKYTFMLSPFQILSSSSDSNVYPGLETSQLNRSEDLS